MRVKTRHRVRWMLTGAGAGLLVVGAASCVWGVWVHHEDGAYREHGFSVVRATVYATYSDRSARASLMSRLARPGWRWEVRRASGSPVVNLGAAFEHASAPIPGWAIRVPLWIPLVGVGVPCGWLWWRHLRRPEHECEACGYDLRGTRGATCPECGRTSAG